MKSVKSLQANIAELKSGGNRGNNPLKLTKSSGSATLPEIGSKVCGKGPPPMRPGNEDDTDSNDEFKSSDEDNHMFLLSEVSIAFMEAVFKTKMNATGRRKQWQSLGFQTANGQKNLNLTHSLHQPFPKISSKLTAPLTKLRDSG